MQIINYINDIARICANAKANDKSIGFVPTMGALHAGHISLVKQARNNNDIVITSIFVNPTQFNDPNDLQNYPRCPDADCALLDNEGCDIAFLPSVNEMYPQQDNRSFDLGSIAQVMEGEHRPGHFNGVAQIVSKLFDIVQPDNAYFGEKDFQQIAVIRTLCSLLKYNVNIVACPIVREPDGLAMSSRNARLTKEQRLIVPAIARTLFDSSVFAHPVSVAQVREFVVSTINRLPQLQVEYFFIVNELTLLPLDNDLALYDRPSADMRPARGCITVWCGNVRLIDNIKYYY